MQQINADDVCKVSASDYIEELESKIQTTQVEIEHLRTQFILLQVVTTIALGAILFILFHI